MMNNVKPETVRSAGYTFPLFQILGVIFITLKLMGYITWSWWWVLAPFWIPWAIVLGVLLILLILFLIAKAVK